MAGNRNAQADAARCGLQESDGSRSLARPSVWRERLPLLSLAEQIMAMPAHAPHRRWTEAEFYVARDAAPAGERWELVDGEVLVTPSPHWGHQDILLALAMRIHPYVIAQGLGKTFTAPLDVKLEPGLVMQPDLLVVPKD